MTTTTDIGNRALQLLGTRTIVTSLAQDSNEAQNLSLSMQAIINWCFGLANWNFARQTAALGLSKVATGAGGWTTAQPAPPWLYEYALPANYVRAIYCTDSTLNAAVNGYLGEAKRFVVANDAAAQAVILSNTAGLILIYTGNVADPTQWPWHFERLVVTAVALSICLAITGDKKLYQELGESLQQMVSIAMQANTTEGLIIEDSTPEWIQAIGINYPSRRYEQPMPAGRRPRGQQDDN